MNRKDFKALMLFYAMDASRDVRWVAVDMCGDINGFKAQPSLKCRFDVFLGGFSYLYRYDQWIPNDHCYLLLENKFELPSNIHWKETLTRIVR